MFSRWNSLGKVVARRSGKMVYETVKSRCRNTRSAAWKTSAAIFALAMPCATFAQSSVTLFGTLDAGFAFLTNSGGTRNSVIKAQSTNIYLNSVRLTGKEDLGGGLQAIFGLSMLFDPYTGASLFNRLFGWTSYVGLSNENNKVVMGRLWGPLYDVTVHFDPLWGSPVSLWAMDAGGVSIPDNAIRYTRTDGPMHEDLLYSFGSNSVDAPLNGVAGGGSKSKEFSASIDYTTTSLELAAIYDNVRGPLQAGQYELGLFVPSLVPVAPTTAGRAERIVVAARYTFEKTSLFAGYRRLRTVAGNEVENSNLYWAGLNQHFTPSLLANIGVYHQRVNSIDARPTLVALQIQYFLSKSTALYATVGKVWNTADSNMGLSYATSTTLGVGQFGASVGMYHLF
ncbi:gram-negative porin family protein [Burkholderia cenocepacia]|uniref:Gram-negative porin family protein n=1 Tax=Burkholderia cenocepacia TaxID=95486 RepID=A0AAN0RXM8_9BURK|nr:gram-negative porin family protein [Burkholderia cenocepacia]